ncbi:alpha-glucosidase [Prauserella rugosa]|uniref:Alpha-glucosidase n=1 Tax=Prauserella rugosa TaxID=43354 RepID=A0A660CCZ4_9PSEU|nr:alpha-glucosidase [Prauserella rugosa]
MLGVTTVLVAACLITWARIPRDDLAMLEAGSLHIDPRVPAAASARGLTVTIDRGSDNPDDSDTDNSDNDSDNDDDTDDSDTDSDTEPNTGDDTGPRITVRSGHAAVWSSDPGHAFLGAGRGELTAEEDRGYFWLRSDHDREWTTQTVDRMTATDRGVVLRGHLRDADGGRGPSWRAEFSATDRGATVDARLDDADNADEAGSAGEAGQATSLGFWSSRTGSSAVHGFGEQFTDMDLDGRLVPVVVREQGVGRGEQPVSILADVTNNGAGGTEDMTYAAWASWVTADLRGVRLDPALPESHALAVADTRTEGRVGLEVQATHLRAELVTADTPLELVARQQSGVDRPPLAHWTGNGAIVGLQGGTDSVRRSVESLRSAGARISGVWLQDWTGRRTTSFGQRLWWTWQRDEERYPQWRRLVADLADSDIAVTTYVNPFLVDPAGKQPAPARNLLAEARARGYLVTTESGRPYTLDQGDFDAYLVDLTDDAARDWYADVIADEVLTDGVRGLMADFGEGLPLDAQLTDGDPMTAHNRWPALWAGTVREACERAEQPDCVTWFRSGSLGMDADAPMFWNGDQLTSFSAEDGLGSVLRGTFSAGVSGWPLVHSDVGGYTSIDAVVKDYVRSPELLARWAELSAFGVLMRTHEGNRPADNTQVYDEVARNRFAEATRIYAALADYRREVVDHATETGVPAIRHGWLQAPDTAAAGVDTQFFFGPSILVAPVLTEGADDVEVTLPPGRWRHLLTGHVYAGGTTRTVPAPIGTPAAFVETSDPWAERLTDALANR